MKEVETENRRMKEKQLGSWAMVEKPTVFHFFKISMRNIDKLLTLAV